MRHCECLPEAIGRVERSQHVEHSRIIDCFGYVLILT